MSFARAIALFATVATLVQAALLAVWTGHFFTWDGNTLRIAAFVVALILAIVLPLGLGFLGVRGLENRGRQPKRGLVIGGITGLLNAAGAGALLYFTASPINVATSGATRLVTLEAGPVEVADAQPVPSSTETETPAKPASHGVAEARKAFENILDSGDPELLAKGLSNESAAALAALWMHFLTDDIDDLQSKHTAAWDIIHRDLPSQPDLWDDPAALEPTLIPRGREVFAAVGQLADAAMAGDGVGPMVAPVLPDSVLATWVEEGNALPSATFNEAAMNRVEVTIADTRFDVRYEDHDWRVHIGDFGDIATRRISKRTLRLALRP